MISKERFTVESSAEAFYLNIALESETFDTIALRMLSEDCRPEFFLPVQIRNINNRCSLQYKLIHASALKFAAETQMNKREFLKFALDLLRPFILCKDWFLDYHYICIDPQYILQDLQMGSYRFLYMPEASLRSTDDEIIEFFRSVLGSIDINDAPKFQISIFRYFNSGHVTLAELYEMFQKAYGNQDLPSAEPQIQPKSPVPEMKEPVRTQPISDGSKPAPSGTAEPAKTENPFAGRMPFGGEKEKVNAVDVIGGSTNSSSMFRNPFSSDKKQTAASDVSNAGSPASAGAGNDDFESIFGSDSKKKQPSKAGKKAMKESLRGFFKFGGKTQPVQTPDPKKERLADPGVSAASQKKTLVQPAPSMPDPKFFSGVDSSETQIMEDGNAGTAYLELIDSQFPGVPRTIQLKFHKPALMIGRIASDTAKPDIAFPEHCTGLGRRHAQITNKDGVLNIIDLGSKYFTLLNQERLIPNTPYPMQDGAVLTFIERKPIRYRVHLPQDHRSSDGQDTGETLI